MPNRWAVATGNWSNTATWNNGAVLGIPTGSDAVFISGSAFTVTIDQDISVLSLSTAASASAIAAGGTFLVSSSRNISAVNGITGSTSFQCLLITGSGITVNITGSSIGGSANPSLGIAISSSFSTINISGSCTAGTSTSAFGIAVWGSTPTNNTITLIGNCSGSTSNVTGVGGFALGANQNNLIITGSLVGGTGNTTNVGLLINTTSPYTSSILGNITGSLGPGLYYTTTNTGTGSITINGNVIGGAGSGFAAVTLPSGCTNATLRVNGSVTAGGSTSAHGISISGTSYTASINGNITGGPTGGASAYGINHVGTSGLVIVTGSVTGGNGASGANYGIFLGGVQNNLIISGSITGGTLIGTNAGLQISPTSPYTASIIGNITSPAVGNGIYFNSPSGQGIVNITGSVTGGNGSAFVAINLLSTTNLTLNISGSVAGGSPAGANAYGINLQSAGSNPTITIRGDVTGSAGTSYGVYNQSTAGVIVISGSVIAQGGIGAYNNSTGQILISGSAIAGTVVGAHNQAGGTLRVISAIASTSSAAINGVSATGTSSFESAIFGSNGVTPWLNYAKLVSGSNNFVSCSIDPTSGGGYKALIDANNVANGQPSASDVRLGTVYNFGNSTGTMAVPSSSYVLIGIPVDNTTGSAVITSGSISSAVWNISSSLLTVSGSIGDRAKNMSTVSSVGDQLVALL